MRNTLFKIILRLFIFINILGLKSRLCIDGNGGVIAGEACELISMRNCYHYQNYNNYEFIALKTFPPVQLAQNLLSSGCAIVDKSNSLL